MPGPPPAFSSQVAHANSTLKTFMGGKQKSWMTNTTPVQPSPRPPRRPSQQLLLQQQPQQQQQQQQHQNQQQPPPPPQSQNTPRPRPQPVSQAPPRAPQEGQGHRWLLTEHEQRLFSQQPPETTANVLPSPAPSDEPSPALSSSKDSPNQAAVSLAAGSPGQQDTRDVPAAQEARSSDALLPSNPHSETMPAEDDVTVPSTARQTSSEARPQAVQWPQAMPPPTLPQSSQTGPPAVTRILDSTSVAPISPAAQVWSNTTGDGEQPSKRRRINPIIGMNIDGEVASFSDLVSWIDKRIAFLGGEQNLTFDVERPRFQILKDACARQDVFYLHLHSLFCSWSIDPKLLPPLPSYDMEAVSIGFGILETVLKKNERFTRANLEWCAAFPGSDFNRSRPESVMKVADFLTSLSQHWPSLLQDSCNRHYPYLMDELLGKLKCYSTVMQNLLFTASRRRLGIQDGELGMRVQQYFDQDLKNHFDENGMSRPIHLSDDPQDIQRRNAALIQAYREIVAKAKAELEMAQRRHVEQQQQQRRQMMLQQCAIQQAQQLHQPPTQQNPNTVQQSSHPQSANAQFNYSPRQTMPSPTFQWPQNQMQNAMPNHMRRLSSNSHNIQLPVQYPARPSPLGAYSGVRSPTFPQNPYSPQPGVVQPGNIPPNLVLPSSLAPVGPMMQAAASAYQHSQGLSGPQQYHFNPPPQAQDGSQLRLRQYASPAAQYQAQWAGGLSSPTVATSPQMPAVQNYGPIQQINPAVSPAPGSMQQPWSQARPQSRMQMQPSMVQNGVAALSDAPRPLSRLIPPEGYVIDRSEYPHSHQEKKSLLMSLHQAHARSPDRTRRAGAVDDRYYQSVQSLAVAPFRPTYYHELQLEVSPEQFLRLCRKTVAQPGGPQAPMHVREYTHGSLRFRIRCCRLQSDQPVNESDWVTREMLWPEHIFIQFNGRNLPIRRGTHNGKDLPVELTDYVLSGRNELKVTVPSAGPIAADRRGNLFYLAVEIIETVSHSEVLKNIQTNQRIDREETLEKIRSRVSAAPDEDGIAVIDRSGDSARELSIDLTDPFSARIFTIPARGVSCTHMECFDLETWLTTRPAKQQIKCGHVDVCTCPPRLEPSEPDKWKCPICFGDARPGSLYIDSFLEGVRQQLGEQNKLDTKSILVAADGTWRPVDEPDDDDEGSDGDGPATRRSIAALRKSRGPTKSLSVERGPVEIIELD